jgi:Fe-S cluster assembly protein SufD
MEAIIYTLVFTAAFPAACRHDLIIQQGGAQTNTTLRHFLLCGAGQVHDLHTSMVLEHPEGKTDQLHKCIVSDATGHGIFDGNVQVIHLCFIVALFCCIETPLL